MKSGRKLTFAVVAAGFWLGGCQNIAGLSDLEYDLVDASAGSGGAGGHDAAGTGGGITEDGATDAASDTSPDATSDASPDALLDAASEADVVANPDTGDGQADVVSDAISEIGTDAVVDVADEAEGGDVDASDSGEDGLLECYDETWCPPNGCTLRTCDQGSCVNAGTMKEDVTTFQLPIVLQCNQSTNRTCAVAVRSYLVVLTNVGFTVFNTRNPADVREETVTDNIGGGYSHLVRSGERVWALKNSSAQSTELAWLDLPMDGVSALSPPSKATVTVPSLSARLAAPNDAVFLFHTDPEPAGYVASYAPGMPTTLTSYKANGAVELTAMASTGARLLLHQRVQHTTAPTTYRHHFSLQSDLLAPTSVNSGTYEEQSLTNTSSTNGYFATSRSGAVAWVIGRYDSTPEWRDLRAYWIVAGESDPINPSSVLLETYTTPPPSTPEGPLAFISNDTIATAVLAGGTSPASSLDIVRRQSGTPPQMVKRIPTSPLAPGAPNVAGDAGFAYIITGTTVRLFAPECNP